MRIDEFTTLPDADKLPFNVVDDIVIFMRNDPSFYRREYLPTMLRLQQSTKKGRPINFDKEIHPLIDRAASKYCQKFNIKRRPDDLLDDTERKEVVDKIRSEESEHLSKGIY